MAAGNINKIVDVAAAVLVIFGGIILGLNGFLGVNIVSAAFGSTDLVSRLIFVLIGLAALYEALLWKSISSRWECHLNIHH